MKKLLIIFTTVLAIVAGIMGIGKLPKRVDALEKQRSEDVTEVQKLAHTVDKYIAVQETKEKKDEEREELLMEQRQQMLDMFERMNEK